MCIKVYAHEKMSISIGIFCFSLECSGSDLLKNILVREKPGKFWLLWRLTILLCMLLCFCCIDVFRIVYNLCSVDLDMDIAFSLFSCLLM